jgi:hypothetical protein
MSKISFYTGSLKNKTIYDVPNIGKKIGDKLKRKGYVTALSLIDIYIKLDSNMIFELWLRQLIPSIKIILARRITMTMKIWRENHI